MRSGQISAYQQSWRTVRQGLTFVYTFIYTFMTINFTWHPEKDERNFLTRGIGFEYAAQMFEGWCHEAVDDRHDYGEQRIVATGVINDREYVVVYTRRGNELHIISARKANAREQRKYHKARTRAGE